MASSRRSPCPVACVLDIIGDKWTLLVIRDMACGKTQFKEFMQSPEKIASNILTERLNRLVEHGLAKKHSMPQTAGREEYQLTEKGRSLLPILKSIADWGLQHIRGTQARMVPK